jgi:hypothetical protein
MQFFMWNARACFCFLRARRPPRAARARERWTEMVNTQSGRGSAAHQWRLWTVVLSFLANAIFVVCVCAPHYGALNCALAALLSARRDRHPRARSLMKGISPQSSSAYQIATTHKKAHKHALRYETITPHLLSTPQSSECLFYNFNLMIFAVDHYFLFLTGDRCIVHFWLFL